ncbi:uncharacterized protein LOC111735437 isoform X3 [Pteropus vampyrus]|uniref:Uncharacterized protein LOC111735437 isoform X3 n=1 Tax=Pteropus vampyrus TaxID=132908 RepID=A0A6P6C5U8_PTEVA|nr:uncharacterized protein LOC111735437 isoform X3 [Pteropus vampyrus]
MILGVLRQFLVRAPGPCGRRTRQLLQVLFTTEEKERILREAARGVTDPNGLPTADLTRIQAVFPTQRPQWDPNTDQDLRVQDK